MDEAEPKSRGRTVILDSNFLFIPLQFGLDIFEDLERLLGCLVRCVVPSPVVDELKLLKQDAKPSLRKEVDFALALSENCERIEEKAELGETADDVLLRLAKRWKCPVATNDSELKRRLRAEGLPVIFLRQRAYLDIEGALQSR